jgi:hypothetical protein
MQAMVDKYKDIPHIEYVLPSRTPLCLCVTFGVICIVKCDKTNVEEQGWLSSVYFHAHFFILFLQVIAIGQLALPTLWGLRRLSTERRNDIGF